MIVFDDFVKSISLCDEPESNLSVCLQALWWARKGDWDKAHDLAQDEGSQNGDWVHAYLHRVEGDLGNAAYWYNRASKPVRRNENLAEEWNQIVNHFLTAST
jgi:hypothetical protein